MSNQEDIIARQTRPRTSRRAHPARRTRRLVGGISVSSTMGLIAAMFLGAQTKASEIEEVLEPLVTTAAPTTTTTTTTAAPTTITVAPTTVAPTTTLAPPPPPQRPSQNSNTKTKGS